MKTILVVDDDEKIRDSITRSMIDAPFETVCAPSAESALDLLAGMEIHLVVSDMLMPGMDGKTFLSRVRESWPNIMRIAVSGADDDTIVRDAVHRGLAMVYVRKPWKNEDLIAVIDKLLESQDFLATHPLFTSYDTWRELPTIPQAQWSLLRKLDGDISLKAAGEAIERDPAISAKLLHIANSAFYGLLTGSVQHAAKFLGIRHLRTLVVSTAIMDLFVNDRENHAIERLWKHAALTNEILQSLYATLLRVRIPDSAAAAGLLHNIGMLFLLWRYKDRVDAVARRDADSESAVSPDEELMFDLSHAAVGGFLLRIWEMPYDIVESALYHHMPEDRRVLNRRLLAAVHVAQHLASRILGLPPVSGFHLLDSLRLLDVTLDDAEGFLDDPLGGLEPAVMRVGS